MLQRRKLLAIDDEKNIQHLIKNEFSLEGFDVSTASSGEEGLQLFNKSHFDLVFLDIKLPRLSGLEILKKLKQKSSSTAVIMITGHGDVVSAVESIKLGAYDYITKPFKLDHLICLAKQVVAEQAVQRSHENFGSAGNEAPYLRCPSQVMQKIYTAMERVALTDSTVLIQGETGVGKDVLAKQIHLSSTRSQGPFVTIDCGMLNQNLAESELYGHRKGAFSGATERKQGLVEKAHKGSLFLDEIGNIDLELQKKFLRFLETGRFRRVGETHEILVDSRIILATNVDVHEAMQQGRLRKDLLFRMDVISLFIPPLRDRPLDIPVLAEAFLPATTGEDKHLTISPSAMDRLCSYPWPGNIRELKSVLKKAAIFSETDVITPNELPLHIAQSSTGQTRRAPKTLVDVEKEHILHVLEETGGNQSLAAKVLGINRKTLYKKINKYQIFSE